jgi:hypothetical protein
MAGHAGKDGSMRMGHWLHAAVHCYFARVAARPGVSDSRL